MTHKTDAAERVRRYLWRALQDADKATRRRITDVLFKVFIDVTSEDLGLDDIDVSGLDDLPDIGPDDVAAE